MILVAAIFITFGSITPLTGAEVFAKSSAYQSGYNHGVSDASGMHSLGPRYILQPGKGFQFHTPEFDRGYVDGFCSIAGPNYSSDADEAAFDCAHGSSSASW
ncbi:MAG: hypothetical protein WBQ25_05020 [Nitrososphaeraceae archaeon]